MARAAVDVDDAAGFRAQLYDELEASRQALLPQMGWFHWRMAQGYASLIAAAEEQEIPHGRGMRPPTRRSI